MKNRIIIAASLLMVFILTGCQDVKKEWLDMLSTNGLAVVFAMFCIFVVGPGFGIALWKIFHWVGNRIDKLLERHMEWMNELVLANTKMADSMPSIVDKLDELVEMEPQWHQKKYEKLHDMHTDIRNTSQKVAEIHTAVVVNKCKKGEKDG